LSFFFGHVTIYLDSECNCCCISTTRTITSGRTLYQTRFVRGLNVQTSGRGEVCVSINHSNLFRLQHLVSSCLARFRSLRFGSVTIYWFSLVLGWITHAYQSSFFWLPSRNYPSASRTSTFVSLVARFGRSTERMSHTEAQDRPARLMLVLCVGVSDKLQLICFSLSIVDWRPASPLCKFTCKANIPG